MARFISAGAMMERATNKYTTEELAAWAMKPTEVRCEFLESSFFVVTLFLWSNRVIIRINMHRGATRNPHMVPWGWGEGRFFFPLFPNILRKKIYLSTLLNSNKKVFDVNIDLN